jgi:soluble lytic murein transglycosylase
MPLSPEAHAALVRGDEDAAETRFDTESWTDAQRADLAFVRAWVLLHEDRADEAVSLLDELAVQGTAPWSYRAWVRGEVLAAAGRDEDARMALHHVEPGSVPYARAALLHARLLRDAGKQDEALAIYTTLTDGPSAPAAHMAAAELLGTSTPEALPHLETLWQHHPATSEGVAASKLLAARSGWAPEPEAVVQRALRWMQARSYDRAIETLAPVKGEVTATPGSEAACALRYVEGRSHYKRNRLSKAVEAFADAGRVCAGVAGDYGHRVAYLQGLAQFRRGRYTASAVAYQSIATLYPQTTYADDGLTRAGIALYEAGELEDALDVWGEALERFPDGDTVPEATWRLAFTQYELSRPQEARETARRLAALPAAQDRVNIRAGRYWRARWALYPDVEAPQRAVDDASARQEAIDGWVELIEEEPRDYYAVLAYNRLSELAPDVAAELAVRPSHEVHPPGWSVRRAFFEDPHIGVGISLARLGLVDAAQAEWSAADVFGEATPEEMSWLVSLRYAVGDDIRAHNVLHWWLKPRPLWEIEGRQQEVIRLAYPDQYWDLIQDTASSYTYPARFQHALVREESSFNPEAVSFAGARGLGQLMPSTARETARWMGRSVTNEELFEPETNLTLGGRYLDAVYRQLHNNPYLTLAGYNAGPHRVKQWLGERDVQPLDEFVERIPFRETRDYVKKVGTTWQVMRYSFDVDEPPFPDLAVFNHDAAGE